MRIKYDFVTNSSSVCYYILVPKNFKKKNIFELKNSHLIDRCKIFYSKKRFIEYTQNGRYDWINDIRGPRDFVSISEEHYNEIKPFLENLREQKLMKVCIERSFFESKEFMMNFEKYMENRKFEIVCIHDGC